MNLEARAAAQEILMTVESSRPAPPHEPPGTMSRIIVYYTAELDRIALAHEYRRPDGTLGGSGQQDPKRIYLDGEILYCS
jgi:hypothetical protein